MKKRTRVEIFFLGALLVASLLAGRVHAQDLIERAYLSKPVTMVEIQNIERFRVDLNSLENDQAVDLVVAPNRSFTLMTSSTNAVHATVDGSTNINFVDSDTNSVGRVSMPGYNLRRSPQVNQVPGLLR
jgi:hypothetical protein